MSKKTCCREYAQSLLVAPERILGEIEQPYAKSVAEFCDEGGWELWTVDEGEKGWGEDREQYIKACECQKNTTAEVDDSALKLSVEDRELICLAITAALGRYNFVESHEKALKDLRTKILHPSWIKEL